MSTDDFLGPVSLDPLGTRVPVDDIAPRIEHENRVVSDCFDEEPKAPLTFAELLEARFKLQRAVVDALLERLIERQQTRFERFAIGDLRVRAKKPAAVAGRVALHLASLGEPMVDSVSMPEPQFYIVRAPFSGRRKRSPHFRYGVDEKRVFPIFEPRSRCL